MGLCNSISSSLGIYILTLTMKNSLILVIVALARNVFTESAIVGSEINFRVETSTEATTLKHTTTTELPVTTTKPVPNCPDGWVNSGELGCFYFDTKQEKVPKILWKNIGRKYVNLT